MSKQRDRGRILTPEALTQLQQAIRDWEIRHEKKCTQERIRELSGEFKDGGLDPGTIGKIRKGKEGVDPESIRCLFQTFGLSLEESDLVAAIAFTSQTDPNFVGREGAIADLKALADRPTKVIVIQARGGVGKTTLARKYLQQEFGTFLEFPIAKETKDIASVESLIEEKLRQLGEEPGREFLVSIDRLKRKLQSERIGILIDNLEPALDSAGKLIEAHRRYVELLRVLADPTVRSLTLITTRERLREPSITVQHYLLRSLDVGAWEAYFQTRNIGTEGETLAALHNAYEGNAKAMDILSGAIAEDFAGDMAAYWQVNQDDLLIERDLEDLVTTQFERIRELDGDAYNLLCRMGCYRYQDVPRVPIEGLLCLLWDVGEGQRRRVVKALQDRSLVDCQDGEYWLHPVIRGEAIERLKENEDWQEANKNSASFWSDRVSVIETIDGAIQAFESYYHYVAIGDFDEAASVILKNRCSNHSKVFLTDTLGVSSLGSSFIRLGISHQIFYSALQVSQQITSLYALSRLYNLLGDLYWIQGLLKEAIDCHRKSGQIAIDLLNSDSPKEVEKNLHNGSKYLSIVYLFNIGICMSDLGDYFEAIKYLEQARLLANQGKLDSIESRSYGNLATLYSYVGDKVKAERCIKKMTSDFSEEKMGVRSAGYKLFRIGETYSNLDKQELAVEAYTKAIEYAEEIGFSQLKGIAIFGLADINRRNKEFEKAISYHIESVKLLEKIGAKPDLAEAYYRFGISWQAVGELEKSKDNFQKAIRLFTEMEAPKQVERVRRSMENQV
jgi:tetratricopeptide (TPR) repeat protein